MAKVAETATRGRVNLAVLDAKYLYLFVFTQLCHDLSVLSLLLGCGRSALYRSGAAGHVWGEGGRHSLLRRQAGLLRPHASGQVTADGAGSAAAM